MPETAAKLPIIRNSGKVAIWLLVRSAGALGGEGREARRKADEQRAADNADQAGDRGERHLAQHQDPHAGKGDADRLAGIVLRPVRHAGEIEQRISARATMTIASIDRNRGRDRIGFGAESLRHRRRACRILLMAMIACTSVVIASNATTTNMNGAIGQPSSTVVRACACRVCRRR